MAQRILGRMPSRSPRPVRVECRKWPDDPHWEFDGVRLGVDGHGTWIGITEGTLLASPVRAFHATADHVTLIPHDDWYLGTFYGDDAKRPFDTYVDIATPAVWHGEDLVRAVDLDLDVIQGTTGRIWVDDEDEFAAHRVALGYPDDVTERAVSSCQTIFAAVTGREAPFDGVHQEWLDRLRRS
jgi:hypothetical protein